MRICHINLARGYRGGERQTELLIRNLMELGVPQRAVVRKGDALAQRLIGLNGLDLVPINRPFVFHAGLGRDWLLHAHESKAAHLVHACHLLTGARYVVTRRVDTPPSMSLVTRSLYCKAAHVVAVSSLIREVLKKYYPDLDPSVIRDAQARLAFDSEFSGHIRARWPGKFIVGHIGALENSHKGQFYIIRAARLLASLYPQLHFVLLGKGRDEDWLRQEAAGMSNLNLVGYMDNVGDWMAAFDLFILPSLHEGLGSTLLDAMSFALPVVATRVGGIPEIVHEGENGLLVAPADEAQLAEAILRLYSEPELRRKLGEGGRRVAGQYTPDEMATAYLRLYREVAEKERIA